MVAEKDFLMDLVQTLAADLSGVSGVESTQLEDMLETPPDPAMGDAALPCFKLAKQFRKAPAVIAGDLKEKVGDLPYVERVEAVGGYLNFYFRPSAYVDTILLPAAKAGTDWGRSDIGDGRTVVIDYSSVNIAKPFHIGHLSSTAIGSALYKIYSYLGYNVIGVNHLGDWGTQFGRMIAAYKHWGDDEEIEREGVNALLRLYVRFHEEAEKSPILEDEGRAWFRRIEDGDEEAMRIFGWFKGITLREAQNMYERLDVTFDSYAGESFYNDMLPGVIDELEIDGLLEKSDGAQIVRLEEKDLPPAVLLKSDGTTLYLTRDVACAEYRKRTYDFYRNLYVVAYQQNLHFRQLFALLKKMGYDWADACEHIAFGMVSFEDETQSTRLGNVVLLKDVLDKAVEKTLEIIEEKSPDLENKEEIAEDVGVGAVMYSALAQSRIKDIPFTFDRVLNFEGETGPYVQYTHARSQSVLARAPKDLPEPDFTALNTPSAVAVMKCIGRFPGAVMQAADKNEPFYVTRSVTELAQAFNKYYYDNKIIRPDDPEGTSARLLLTRVVRDVLYRGLALLGIKAPDRM